MKSFSVSKPAGKRRLLWGAAALVVAELAVSACAAGGSSKPDAVAAASTGASGAAGAAVKTAGFKVYVEDGYTGNTWRTQTNDNMSVVAAKLKSSGALSDFKLLTSPNDANTQLTHIQSMIADKPDAILFAPINSASAETAVQRIKAAGIMPIVIVDPEPTKDALNVVGGDNTWWKIQAEWLAEKLNGKGNILVVTGLPGNGSDRVRQESVKLVLAKFPGIHVVASVAGNWDPGVARTAVAPVLSKKPQIDAILTQDIMATGIIQAFKAANQPLPKLMTGDYTCAFIRQWKSDLPDLESIGLPYSPTVGSDALRIVVKMLAGNKLKSDALVANEVDPTIQNNALLMPPALSITRDGKPGAWTPSNMSVITRDEAVTRCQGKPDTYALEAPLTDESISGLFQ